MLPHAQAATLDAVVTTMYRLTVVVSVWCFTACPPNLLYARDDGRFADSPLKEWFEHLRSRNGLCCTLADGVSVQDVDWDTQEGHYRVRIQGQWFVVPDAAVVTEPNRCCVALSGPRRRSEAEAARAVR